MAEVVMSAAVQVMLENLVTIVGREFNLIAGFESELESLKETLEMTRNFVNDAAGKQVQEGAVKLWLKNLQTVAYQAEDLVDEVNYEFIRRKEVIRNQMNRKTWCMSFSCCKTLAFRSKMAHKMEKLNQKLKKINGDANEFGLKEKLERSAVSVPAVFETDSMIVDPVIGRENDASQIINMMTVDSNDDDLSVLPIVGQGGLGKTTLAQSIFNDERIEEKFEEKIWVCVAENFNTTELLKRILTSLTKDSFEVQSRAEVVDMLKDKLKGKRYLLILDDLWNENKGEWVEFERCLRGISKNKRNFVLVTTRSHKVASNVNTLADHQLSVLSDDDCWSIIKKRAFSGGEVPHELEVVGKEISRKCKGLPLAANMAGATLQGKSDVDDWKSILQNGFSDPDTGEDSVLQVLKVSYDRLPSSLLKKCFAYCSIFQKDEELEREVIVQLWMAEGFLIETRELDMESLGNRVFDTLLRGCFFQESKEENYGDKTYYQMHDLVHDMACSVSEGESFNGDGRQVLDTVLPVRYLAIKSLGGKTENISKDKALHLRTLISGREIPDDRYQDLKHLRVLDISRSKITDLSTSIGKLIHLRYLDVSHTDICALPESICELVNLQTLRIIGCRNIEGFPDTFHRLENLRHLVMDQRTAESLQIPLGIGNLSRLRTFEFFTVGCDKGRQIEELGCLMHLKGSLTIQNLELIHDKDDDVKANLGEKPNIHMLLLRWSQPLERSIDEGEDENNDEEVLEGLKPHKNINFLTISGFLGDHFPSWTLNMTVGEDKLNNLTELRLFDCRRCQEIPTLGHLPHLKILVLHGLRKVNSIGPRFYYPTQNESGRSTDTWFPALPLLEKQLFVTC